MIKEASNLMALVMVDLTYPSAGQPVKAFYARPEGAGPFAALVVIHEIFGLNDNIRDIARRFGEEGYATLAVDLFSHGNRAVCMARLMGGMVLNSLHHQGIKDLKAALAFLSARKEVDPERLGAVGYCLGGSFALAWACTDHRLKAIAPYYGMNPRPLEAVSRLCPVVGSYPGEDFTTSHARKLDHELDLAQVPHDIKIYPGTKHSFFNDQGAAFSAAAAEDSWQRILAFFKQKGLGVEN